MHFHLITNKLHLFKLYFINVISGIIHSLERNNQPEEDAPATPLTPSVRPKQKLIKTMLLTPGKVVSVSRLIDRGVFRNKEIDGIKEKNLVIDMATEIETNRLATVERFN